MPPATIASLRSRLPGIKARWERLLAGPDDTYPLHPTGLAFMIDWSCEEVLRELARGGHTASSATTPFGALCERNPFGRFFAAGEAAFGLALGPCVATLPAHDAAAAENAAAAEFSRTFGGVGGREIAAYCTVCPIHGTCGLYQAHAA